MSITVAAFENRKVRIAFAFALCVSCALGAWIIIKMTDGLSGDLTKDSLTDGARVSQSPRPGAPIEVASMPEGVRQSASAGARVPDFRQLDSLRQAFLADLGKATFSGAAISADVWSKVRISVRQHQLTADDLRGLLDIAEKDDPVIPFLLLSFVRVPDFGPGAKEYLMKYAAVGLTSDPTPLSSIAAVQALRYSCSSNELGVLLERLSAVQAWDGSSAVLRLILADAKINGSTLDRVRELAVAESTTSLMRSAAWTAIGRSCGLHDVTLIYDAISRGDTTALEGLRHLGNPSVAPYIEERLKVALSQATKQGWAEVSEQFVAGVEGLVAIGDRRGLEFIESLRIGLEGPARERIERAVAEAIGKATNPSLFGEIVTKLSAFDPGVRDGPSCKSMFIRSFGEYWSDRRMPSAVRNSLRASLRSAIESATPNVPLDPDLFFYLLEWGTPEDAPFLESQIARDPGLGVYREQVRSLAAGLMNRT